ncbi:MAG TPA: diphosphate--fructose-6-phosphate 1-phosphotransferase [Anaerolineae bacterium]|nr:diphosphate--fructose-6-phosphate 1-phosphotransferase [Anaerolineae bacterium]
MISEPSSDKIGILVGGGPAPGINSVIHSATIEAINNGLKVVGIYDGFKHLMHGEMVGRPLTISDVSRIHLDGGSILRTSRANPTKSEESLGKCVHALIDAGVAYLVAIGGDDTAYSAYRVARYAEEHMGVRIKTVHVPKTIDNDLPLPEGIPTFGFETARELGTRIVMNLMEDALTGLRWFLVVTQGRKTGHLALGVGKSSGATLTLIPEEWGGREIRLQEVTDILAASVIKRLAEGKSYGLALVAEGIMEQLAHADLETLDNVERDAHGHIRLAEINTADILKRALRKQLLELGVDMGVVSKDLGYELRCADPIAFDIDYTRSLGEAAVDFLLEGGSNATITLQQNQVVPIPLEKMMDPNTGRTEVRVVKIDSFTYQSAYKFMIRLKPQDAENGMLLARMATQTNLSLEGFKARFGYLIGIAPRPF